MTPHTIPTFEFNPREVKEELPYKKILEDLIAQLDRVISKIDKSTTTKTC